MRISEKPHALILALLIAAQAAITFCFAVTLHYEFKTSGLDGTVYEQVLHNVLAGHGFMSNINPPFVPQNWLGFHFSPVLWLLVPFYALYPHIETLLAIGSLCVALAAWPVYLAARTILEDSFLGLIAAVLYLINPFTLNGVIWDFHEVDLAPLVISWMLYAVVTHRPKLLAVLSIALLCIKEHYGLSVAGFGLLWACHWRKPKAGLGLAALGFGALFIVIAVLIPHFSISGKPVMMDAASTRDRFGWIASSEGIKLHFGPVAGEASGYLLELLLPFLLLPLGAPLWLLPGAADFATNLISLEGMMRSVGSYHSIALVPVLTIASCKAIRNLRGRTRFTANDLMLPVVVSLAGFAYTEAALPWSGMGNFWEFTRPRFSYDANDAKALTNINAMIPADAPVAAQLNVLPHLAPRYEMTPYPGTLGNAEFAVFQLRFPFKANTTVFGEPYGTSAPDFIAQVDALLHSKGWSVAYYADRWLVLQKGGAFQSDLLVKAEAGLGDLQKEYDAVHAALKQSYRKQD